MKTNYHISQQEVAERKLLNAALKLVAEKGSARMTLAEVGQLAGYSRTLPAHHFGNRAGLLKALVKHVHELLFEQARTSPIREQGLSAIVSLVHFYLRPEKKFSLAQRAVYALRLEALSGDPEVAEQLRGFYRKCEDFVEAQLKIGIERGEIRADVDPVRQTIIILGTLRGTLAQWLSESERSDLAMVRDDIIDNLKRSLAADCESPVPAGLMAH